MRYKKVLLVSPTFTKGRNRLALLPHAGLAYIENALKRSGIHVNVMDMNLGHSIEDLKSKIYEFRPELVGLTAMTLGYKYLYDMINQLKNLYPDIKIVLGGAHISALRERVLADCQGLDYGIICEGDISMPALCTGENLNEISGLIYRNGNDVIVNKLAGFLQNLDDLSFPKYGSFELAKYPTRQLGISTSRGCPYDCIYCSVIATSGKKFRVRSAESIVNEIEYWYNRGYREIFILDDNFTLIRKRVEELCQLLRQKDMQGLHIKCPNGIRADKVDRELLRSMKEVGFDFIAFGIEAASSKVLKNLKKGEEDIEKIENSIKDACDLGFDVDLFFLIGSPGETMEDVKMSFSLARRYPLRRAIFYNLIPLPATELLQWLNYNNYLIYPLDKILNDASYYKNEPCFFTPEMSIGERKRALAQGQKVMIETRRRFIERKITGPLFFKRLFSLLYTLPVFDNALNNNRLIVQSKERIKKLLIK